MADITVYTLEQVKPGSPEGGPYETEPWGSGDWESFDYDEAKEEASKYGLLVIGNTFVWSDSEPLDDFSPRCETCELTGELRSCASCGLLFCGEHGNEDHGRFECLECQADLHPPQE